MRWVCGLILVALTSKARGHDVPSQLPVPLSVAEALNVIEASSGNIAELVEGNLLRDVTFQVANADGALRYLAVQRPDLARACEGDLAAGDGLVSAVRAQGATAESVRAGAEAYRNRLAELEEEFPAAARHAEVYICPMHPGDRHLVGTEKCSACGMGLVRRHLPASAVYQRPGEPTLRLTATCGPLVVGEEARVTLHLARADGVAVRPRDLLEMHTKKIHLLVNDRSLSDYHHEHPEAGDVAGEYTVRFTPRRPGPYRLWADVVPGATGVQEYVVCDLPAATEALSITDREERLVAMYNGRRYELALVTNGGPVRAGQTVLGTISVSGADGAPFTGLEPVMNAFAHLVGFNEDLKTVLHIHPAGAEPRSEADRAGPAFAFKFYAPAAGFYRLYGQVQIGGEQQFPGFGVRVVPSATPSGR